MLSNPNSSGISTTLQAIADSVDKGSSIKEKEIHPQFIIKIANKKEERESVFQMGYQIYLAKGFIIPNSKKWLIQKYDFDSETVILIVQDQDGNLAGSLTLVFDEYSILPAEKIYKNEVLKLRNSGEKLVELSRLIINPKYRNSKEILVLLFNYLAIYSYHVKNYSSLVIEVNPKHKEYYKSLLNFDEIGVEKECPIVQNAPAVLLHLPLQKYQSEVFRCNNQTTKLKKERSLYSFFLKLEQENLVANYLERQFKNMSLEEKIYFGFLESNHQLTVV